MCMHVVGVFLDLDLISVYGLYGFSVRSLWLCFLNSYWLTSVNRQFPYLVV